MIARILIHSLATMFSLVLEMGTAYATDLIVGKVISVQDGDTITLVDENQQTYRIRLSGIDAPEKDQPWGGHSRSYLAGRALDRFAVASCPKMDRYRRWVCLVRIDETDIALMQLVEGYAWHYKKYEQEQHADERAEYARAEVSARLERKGLWQDDTPIPPWDWRRQNYIRAE